MVWPFDQRQVALVQKEASTSPDAKTVAQIMDGFVKEGRVRWVTQKGGPSQLIPFSIPRDFQWQSPTSVRNLGLKLKVDGLLSLSQRGVQIDLQWYGTIDGQPLFFETVNLPDAGPRAGEDEIRHKRLDDWIHEIWSKIPGQGYLVRRDLTTVSLEGAKQIGLKVGDVIEIRRLQKVERHALLKTLIGISSSVTGKAVIQSLEDPFAVAKIDYESALDPIQEGDRYLVLKTEVPKPAVAATAPAPGGAAVTPPAGAPAQKTDTLERDEDGRAYLPLFGDRDDNDDAAKKSDDENKAEPAATPPPNEVQPKYRIVDVTGWLSGSSVTHTETATGIATPYAMSGLAPGFKLQLRAYITKQILLLSDLGFAFMNFGGSTYGVSSIGSGIVSLRLGVGYRYIFSEGVIPGEIVASLGFRRLGLTMSAIASDVAPTAKTYTGYEVGLGIQMPVDNRFGLYVRGSRMLYASLSESPVTGGDSASNLVWQFEGGVKYRINGTSELLGGIQVDSAESNYSGTATRVTSSLSTLLSSTTFQTGYTIKY